MFPFGSASTSLSCCFAVRGTASPCSSSCPSTLSESGHNQASRHNASGNAGFPHHPLYTCFFSYQYLYIENCNSSIGGFMFFRSHFILYSAYDEHSSASLSFGRTMSLALSGVKFPVFSRIRIHNFTNLVPFLVRIG